MIVLDTHVILWNALSPEKVSRKAKEEILKADETTGIIFCEISLWEIALLVSKNRINLGTSFQSFIKIISKRNNFIFKGITPEIAFSSTNFASEINNDPADRIISATSIHLDSPLITADKNLRNSKIVKTILVKK